MDFGLSYEHKMIRDDLAREFVKRELKPEAINQFEEKDKKTHLGPIF